MTLDAKTFIQNLQKHKQFRRLIVLFNYYLYKILSKNVFLAGFYRILFSQSFHTEIKVVTQGIFNYYKTINDSGTSIPLLRRNIHRMEKGLTMRPLKKVFAIDYLEETIEAYRNALKRKDLFSDRKQMKWAHDVLGEYFKVCKNNHPLVKKFINEFNLLPKPLNNIEDEKYIPYPHFPKLPVSQISYEEFLSLSIQRRSVRWFKQKKVSRQIIDKAITIAKLAPSACNRQPFQYRIFDNKKLVQEISAIPYGCSGYAENIPVFIAITGNMSNFFSPRDRHLIYIDVSLSAMAFMYALETLGLSSTCINMPAFLPLERKMSKLLNLAPYEHPVMLLGVGYPDNNGLIAYSKKKTVETLRTYNH